jgi:hypothetical protein
MGDAEISDRLQQAIALAQAGQQAEARDLLQEIVAADPGQTLAWMWLATVAPHHEERVRYLERVLALEPDNRPAQQAYLQLTGQNYAPPRAPQARSGWRRALFGDAPVGLGSYLIILLVGAIAVVVIALAAAARDDEPAQPPTPPALPFALPSPTPTLSVSPTPSNTPWPTRTPGPSPTSIWDAPPPTWTAVPTDTPTPSPTLTPTATPTYTATPSATPTPSPTTSARTPRPATRTAAPPATGTALATTPPG